MTFFGGSADERFVKNKDWVHDSTVTLLGNTTSDDLPVTPDAYQAWPRFQDGFVTKFSADLSHLIYCSYLGGSGDDQYNSAFVVNADCLWVIGSTLSNSFPTTPNAIQSGRIGLTDGFVQYFAIDTTADTTSATTQPFIPNDFSFSVYPNPFNPVATLSFTLPKASNTQLFIHDILGRLVESKDFARLEAGAHEFQVDGSQWATGLYFATLKTNADLQTIKLLLVR